MTILVAKKIRSEIKQAKKQKEIQLFKRLNVILAVATGRPIDKAAGYHNVSIKVGRLRRQIDLLIVTI